MASLLAPFLVCLTALLQQLHFHVSAAPIAPNMSSCHLPAVAFPSEEPLFDCCAPAASYHARLFRPSSTSTSFLDLRVRRPSHLASSDYAAKLARAYALMKALPSDDPRSFTQQANIHCAYCNSVYNQINSTQLFQVHGSWLFMPFHRWYLYFHERILAKLLDDDDTFALTFWNYDHHNASSIPWLFDSYNDTLVSFLRDPLHVGPNSTIVSIDDPLAGDGRPCEEQLRENEYAMYRTLIRDASTQEEFFGLAYRQGDLPAPGAGSLENVPHNNVHTWVGNKFAVGLKDMGSFYAAARDPIFYAHHAQLDRMWEIWKGLPYHEELRDEDYLNSEFFFYNEDAELVRVKVGDALDTASLGYLYEEVEIPWKDTIITSCASSSGPADLELTSNTTMCTEGDAILAPCSLILEKSLELMEEGVVSSPWLDQRLVLRVQANRTSLGAHLDIYVNLPSANPNTGSGCTEFLHGLTTMDNVILSSKLDLVNITVRSNLHERLVDLRLTEETSLVVTLVPSFPVSLSATALTLLSYSTESITLSSAQFSYA